MFEWAVKWVFADHNWLRFNWLEGSMQDVICQFELDDLAEVKLSNGNTTNLDAQSSVRPETISIWNFIFRASHASPSRCQ